MLAETIPPHASLSYPIAEAPGYGEPVEVADGIFWVRLPLPGRLDHVNVWLLRETDGWTIIDCGSNTDATAAIWDRLFATILSDLPVRSLVVTHNHVDHVGYVARLLDRTSAELTMTLVEYLSVVTKLYEPVERMSEQSLHALVEQGCPQSAIDAMISRRRDVRQSYSGIPACFTRAVGGQTLSAGGRSWQIHTFGGHSPEMLCLYQPEEKIFIAGDQLLPRITPSINVPPTEPDGDPLSIFFQSFPKLKKLDPGTFVLPSHGLPFHGLHLRVDQTEAHHERRLASILSYVVGEVSAFDVALREFPRAMASTAARQAVAETLAHLHFLRRRGEVRSYRRDDRVVIFSKI